VHFLDDYYYMIRPTPLLLFVFIIVMISVTSGWSQSENPLAPPFPAPKLGVEGGIGINQQQGEYASNCGCTFPSGNGSGFILDAIGERFLGYQLSLVGRFGVLLKNTSSSLMTDTNQTSLQNGAIVKQTVPFTEQASVKLTYIAFTPTIRYYILTDRLFAEVGPSFGFLLSSNLNATEQVSQSGYTFTDGSTERQIQNGSITNGSTFNMSLFGGIGYTFQLKGRLAFSPEVFFMLPLTSVQDGSNWKIMSYQVTGTLSWTLHY